jgi:hypothetical protein
MAYTPELSDEASCTLRRIAWGLRVPMTVTLDIIMRIMPLIIDKEKVCEGCQDKTKCDDCSFSQEKHRNCYELISMILKKGEINLCHK